MAQMQGHLVAAGLASVLGGSMGFRAVKSGKMMPGGAVAAIGVASMLYHTKKYLEWS